MEQAKVEEQKQISVKIQILGGNSLIFKVLPTTGIHELQKLIENEIKAKPEVQRLVYSGKILSDNKTIADCGIKDNDVVNLSLKVLKTEQDSSSASQSASNTSQNTSPEASARPGLVTRLSQLRQNISPSQFDEVLRTLTKICDNILNNPNEEKYRKLKLSNAAFKRKVSNHRGGLECVYSLGFTQTSSEDILEINPSAEAWNLIVICRKILGTFSGESTEGLGMPNFQDMMQRMQDPIARQQMLNNPILQQMAQRDPQLLANLSNPSVMENAMQMLQSNPQLLQRMQERMSNPQAMREFDLQANQQLQEAIRNPALIQNTIQHYMQQHPNIARTADQQQQGDAALSSTPSGNAAAQGTNTEDEELAEALKRSLNEK